MSLTRTQSELLEAIQAEIEDDGNARCLFKIADIADIDYHWAHRNLQTLIEKGIVKVKRKRCLEIKVLASVDGGGLEVEF